MRMTCLSTQATYVSTQATNFSIWDASHMCSRQQAAHRSAGNNLCNERLLPVGVALWQCLEAMDIVQAEFDGWTGTVVLDCIQGINTLLAEALPTWKCSPNAFWLACGERTSSVGYMLLSCSCTNCSL